MSVKLEFNIEIDDPAELFAELVQRQIREGAADNEQQVREAWSNETGELNYPMIAAYLWVGNKPAGCHVSDEEWSNRS